MIVSRTKIFIAVSFLFAFAFQISAQQSNVVIGTEHRIQSRTLGEERTYLVNLPASYENDDFYIRKKYPVLILLNGATHFHSASGNVRFMSGNEQIPEMIIVAVLNTNRTRDFTPTKSGGGADNFLKFLETELLPQIDKSYRTLPYRVLIGHSLGGLFAVNSFLNQKVFNAYVAIDPSLAQGKIVKEAKEILATNKSFKSILYVSQANNPFNEGKNTGERGAAFQEFTESLAENKSEKLKYKYDFFENEDHFSVPLLSIYQGLLFAFDGYKFPLNTLANKNSNDIKKHYKSFSERLNFDLQPPGKLLNTVGLFLLNSEKKADKAIEIFKLNQEYYPQAFVTYNSLADAYKAKGEKDLAIINYKKSLEINPNNENAKRSIAELMQKTNPSTM